jgi:hypothetical protein
MVNAIYHNEWVGKILIIPKNEFGNPKLHFLLFLRFFLKTVENRGKQWSAVENRGFSVVLGFTVILRRQY